MTAQTFLLLSCVALLACALMGVWMTKAKPAKTKVGTLQIEVELDSSQAMAGLKGITAALERIAKLQAQTGLDGMVGLPVYETKGRSTEVSPGAVRDWFENSGPAPKLKPRHRKPTQTPAKRERKG